MPAPLLRRPPILLAQCSPHTCVRGMHVGQPSLAVCTWHSHKPLGNENLPLLEQVMLCEGSGIDLRFQKKKISRVVPGYHSFRARERHTRGKTLLESDEDVAYRNGHSFLSCAEKKQLCC